MNAKLPAINTSVRPATITDHQATMGDRSKFVFAAAQYVIQAIRAMMNSQIMGHCTMTDPLFQTKQDDIGPAYLARRERNQENEDLDFLFAGSAQASEAQAAPAGSIGKTVAKEIPPTIAKQGADDAAQGAEGFEWSVENVLDAAGRGVVDFAKGTVVDGPRAVVGGVRDAGQEFLDATRSLAEWLNENVADLGKVTIGGDGIRWESGTEGTEITLPDVEDPDTVTGGIYKDVAQFITGFIPVLRVTKMAKVGTGVAKVTAAAGRVIPRAGQVADKVGRGAGRFAEASLAGAIADATVFGPHEERLADLVQSYPSLQNPVTAYLASDPSDSEAEARFKRALEGLGLGALIEGLGGVLRTLRAHRLARSVRQEGSEEALPALGDSTKPLAQVVEASDDQVSAFRGPLVGENKVAVPNLARIETTDDVKEVIAKTAEVFAPTIDEARQGRVSNAETAKLASDLGMTVDGLLGRRRGEAFNAEEALAARQILASSGEQLVTLARKAATADASPADVLAFRRALSVHTSIQAQVSGMTAEAGRALQAFKITAKGSSDRERQIREMIEGNGGDWFNRDMAHKLADIARENPARLNRAAREMSHASGWEQMYEVWVNGLLSGPQTHAVNVLSNTLVALWQVPERFLSSKIGQAFGDGGVQAGEATAQAFGMVHGFKDGLKLAAKTMRTGEGSDVIGKVEQSSRSFTAENFTPTRAGRVVNFITAGSLERGGIAARGVDLLGDVARVPSRLVTAEDELFKTVGYRMELQAQAFRTASAEGLKGEAMAKRIADIVANPPENLHLAAVDAARYQTFTKPLGEAGQAAQKWIRKIPALRLLAPFVRTPTNILKYVGERTPLAVLSKSVRADIAAGGARRDLALARIGLGTMVMGVVADMTASGTITGGGPSNKEMRSHLRNTGWQPYSVKIGDTWYSYNRLDPLGMTLGLAADTAEIMGQTYGDSANADMGPDELAAAAVMAVAKNVTSKTWLTGVSELIEAIEDPDRNMTRFLQRYAGTLVPAGVAQVNRTFFDPTQRDTMGLDPWQSMVNQVRSKIPGYSDDLPPRTNVWGDPIVLGGGMGPDIVSPIYTSKGKPSPADQELLRLGVPITMPQRQINGIKLTAHEYHRYVVLAGNEVKDPSTGLGLKDTIDKLVDGTHPLSSAYKRASDGQDGGKALLIKRFVTGFREQARVQLRQEIPELRDLVEDAKKERARALTGQ